ncbi:MAG: hypothetical protein GF401_14435 [Chitinivibrionales bacterium]|nr:hypothetical protein [Chitinivibrionales bacterium]
MRKSDPGGIKRLSQKDDTNHIFSLFSMRYTIFYLINLNINLQNIFTDILNMNERKRELIKRAREQYQDIFPCTTRSNLDDCFTVENDRILFWFNTLDASTHILTAEF